MSTGVLTVNKPQGWTSHDVVAKLRGIYHQKRIGHSGTLDPMATGVLVVFLGRATRAVELCEAETKEYLAGIRLGIDTDTQDITGKILRSEGSQPRSREEMDSVLSGFLGKQSQIPPMYSAVKVDGRKLYELARQGRQVERKPREITIHAISLEKWDGLEGTIRICCSRGTYVRTICHDIGERLGTCACMTSLVRTRSGEQTLADALSMDEIVEAAAAGDPERLLRPVDSLFAEYPAVPLCGEQVMRCRNGCAVPIGDMEPGIYRVYAEDGEFLMLGRWEEGSLLTVKSFFEVK